MILALLELELSGQMVQMNLMALMGFIQLSPKMFS